MVFQKPTPFPMSIYDNIAFGVRLFEKLSRADMDERVQWALTKAALWNETKDKLHQSGYSLSVVSSSDCVLRVASPFARKCFCLMSHVQRSTLFLPGVSKS